VRRGFLLLGLVLVISISIIATAPRLAYPFFENSLTAENYLTISTDRKIYSPGDTMKITIKNISDNSIWFGGLYYDLVFEMWDGTTWQHLESIRQPAAVTGLQPGQEGHVTHRTKLYSYPGEEYAPGKYRVGTAGLLGGRDGGLPAYFGGSTPPAYAEFEVRKPSIAIWIVLAIIVVVAAVGITIAYLVRERIHG